MAMISLKWSPYDGEKNLVTVKLNWWGRGKISFLCSVTFFCTEVSELSYLQKTIFKDFSYPKFMFYIWKAYIAIFLLRYRSCFSPSFIGQQPKITVNPCQDKLMKLANALQASEGKINGPVYKYVKEVEECYRLANIERSKKGRAGTLFYLSKYLDLGKFKKK